MSAVIEGFDFVFVNEQKIRNSGDSNETRTIELVLIKSPTSSTSGDYAEITIKASGINADYTDAADLIDEDADYKLTIEKVVP